MGCLAEEKTFFSQPLLLEQQYWPRYTKPTSSAHVRSILDRVGQIRGGQKKSHKSIERLNWNLWALFVRSATRCLVTWSGVEPFVETYSRIGFNQQRVLCFQWGIFYVLPFIIRFRSLEFSSAAQFTGLPGWPFSSMPLHLLNRPMPHWRHCHTVPQMRRRRMVLLMMRMTRAMFSVTRPSRSDAVSECR